MENKENNISSGREFIVLVNPVSGTSEKGKIIAYIERRLQENKLSYRIFPTSENKDYTDISRIISAEAITDIVIIGGDGTVNNVIGALRRHNVNFGIIPFGSGNGLARSAGIPMNAKKAFERILSGKPRSIDAFEVNGEFACMLAGFGLDAQVAHDFAESKSRGLLTYIRKTINAFFKAKPYLFEIEVNENKFSTEAYFICVANANQFGNNFKIAPAAELDDALLDIVVVPKMGKIKLLTAVTNQIRGKNPLKTITHFSGDGIIYLQSSTLCIHNPQKSPLHIDGEPVIHTEKQYKIDVLTNSFKIF